jgi:hypothetical protein
MERRLQRRYLVLVKSHMQAFQKLAAGIKSLASTRSSFAATQGAWRFLGNERVTLPALVRPLHAVAVIRAAASSAKFHLLAHDWSKLNYTAPKRDLVQLTHARDVGYELSTALLLRADNGSPLAPMQFQLKTAHGVLSTHGPAAKDLSHLDQVLPTMEASKTWGLSKPIVHVVDREVDSVDHYRQWNAQGHAFLIRADDRRVKWYERPILLSKIAAALQRRKELRWVGPVDYHGRQAELWVAETNVVLYRAAKKSRAGKKFEKPGRPLSLRYVVAQVRDADGKVLAQWMLLSNVPMEWATTEHLARCYYWRWQIESYFKLLKSHGLQLEQWQQETGPAIARRLLVAAMACVVVWQLQADDSPAAIEFKNVLIRLSGRQTKRHRPHTAPALLAGLWVLFSMLSLLEHYDLRQLKRLAAQIPFFDTG